MFTWEAHSRAVTSLAFLPDGGLLTTGVEGIVKHWDVVTASEQNSWKLAEPAQTAAESDLLRVIADAIGRYAVVGLRSSGLQFIDLSTGSVRGEFRMIRLDGITPSPLGETVFCSGARSARESRVWELRIADGSTAARSDARNVASTGLAVSPDARQVISGRRRFSWPDGKVSGPETLATGNLFAVSPDGDKLFGVNGTRLMVWGLQTGAVRQKLKGHLGSITGLTATPDGRKLWTASADATVRQWDVETYNCEKCYGLKIGPLGCVAVSADGLTAAAGSAHNGHVAVWDLG